MSYEILPWDSDFFNFKVARITGEALDNSLLKRLAYDEVELCYYYSPKPTSELDNSLYDLKLADKKITYYKSTQYFEEDFNITSYCKKEIDNKLLRLSIRSGKYSRFNLDEKIGKEKFELLYKLWIQKSVQRKIADEVFVYNYNNDIAGFVTVNIKKETAEIGIIAVDEKYTRMGIGKALMRAAESYAKSKCSYIKVVTQMDNKPACRLYESYGYATEKVEYIYHLWRKGK